MCADILPPPEIDWQHNGEPIARQFDDVYFAANEGLKETDYVFLQHNQLKDRFGTLPNNAGFCIAETGFGSGMNFLAAAKLWQETAPASAHLHFISVEKHPFSHQQLANCHRLWPELKDLSDRLNAVYPTLNHRGFHRCHFSKHIHLTLIFDDAHQALQQLQQVPVIGPNVAFQNTSWSGLHQQPGLVDAWFLDGFAPSKNPDMWQDTLYENMSALSRHGASFATFTAAGHVKRGLQAAGFQVEKKPGFGKKRDMLCGRIQKAEVPPPPATPVRKGPKFSPAWHAVPHHSPGHNRAINSIAVLGAGLAGAHTANALANAGFQVDVFEKNAVASGASGNPKGVLYTALSQANSEFSQFNLSSYLYAARHYAQNDLFDTNGRCGVFEVAENAEQQQRLKQLATAFTQTGDHPLLAFLEAGPASELAGVALPFGALHFKQAGWLRPKRVCQTLLDHPNIRVHENTDIQSLTLQNDWQLKATDQSFYADAVVVCCAHDSLQLLQERCTLPLKTIRGQVSLTSATQDSADLRTVLCGTGYICPAENGQHCLGATFDLKEKSLAVTEQDHLHNLAKVSALSPNFHTLNSHNASGRSAFRCTTPDYLPIVGPVPQENALASTFAKYRDNANFTIDQAGAYWPGLFANVAHGAKGLTSAPLCAELLLNQITHSPLPLPRHLALALHPARFIIRDLVKGKR